MNEYINGRMIFTFSAFICTLSSNFFVVVVEPYDDYYAYDDGGGGMDPFYDDDSPIYHQSTNNEVGFNNELERLISIQPIGDSFLDEENKKNELKIESMLGRKRQQGWLGFNDQFPSIDREAFESFPIEVHTLDIEEDTLSFSFRGQNLRKLRQPVERWPHVEALDDNEPAGCGYPVCALIDSRPKRFKSLCSLVSYMNREGMRFRVIEVQKGGCEDAIEDIGLDRVWAGGLTTRKSRRGYGALRSTQCECGVDHYKSGACQLEICVNDNGHAKTMSNTCAAIDYLMNLTNVTLIAIGLGKCRDLYSSCMYTEWFDLDEPSGLGEIESVYISHVLASNMIGRQGSHRSCSYSQIQFPAQFATLTGQGEVRGQIYSKDREKFVCMNKYNSDVPLQRPYLSHDKSAHCHDWKIRYCCKNLWGEAVHIENLPDDDVIVDRPINQKLFHDCNWNNFLSATSADSVEGDIESRSANVEFDPRATCGTDRFSSLAIDARTVEGDVPWDETGEFISKNNPVYGLYCNNENSISQTGRKCSDYKVRFCCQKESASHWSTWSSWSECSKSCGSGKRSRDRHCDLKTGDNVGCNNDGPHGEHRFKHQEENCNVNACPRDIHWGVWKSWTLCSVTCGSGFRQRRRECVDGSSNDNADMCPPAHSLLYTEKQSCNVANCKSPKWTDWTTWSTCSTECGVGSRTRRRCCMDPNIGFIPMKSEDLCVGRDIDDERCEGVECRVDGAWTNWEEWSSCNKACGDDGTRVRQRYCAMPFPAHGGRVCEGDSYQRTSCVLMKPCPVHCLYSEWGEWESCSVTCGSSPEAGTRVRRRHIAQNAAFGGTKCSDSQMSREGGDHMATIDVSPCVICASQLDFNCLTNCSVPCRLSEWSEWSGKCGKCYKSNVHVVQTLRHRTRFVLEDAKNGGKACLKLNGQPIDMSDGLEVQERGCRPDIEVVRCPSRVLIPHRSGGDLMGSSGSNTVWSFWGIWSAWSECSSECDEGDLFPSYDSSIDGHRDRNRRCYSMNEHLRGKRSSEAFHPYRNPFFGGQYYFGVPTSQNRRTRGRDIHLPHFGQSRSLGSFEVRSTSTTVRPMINDNTYTGSSFSNSRSNTKSDDGCAGLLGDTSQSKMCKPECSSVEWGDWSDWSACEVRCGKGLIRRARTCSTNPTHPLYNISRCQGSSDEERECDNGPCHVIEPIVTVGHDPTGLVSGVSVDSPVVEIHNNHHSVPNYDRKPDQKKPVTFFDNMFSLHESFKKKLDSKFKRISSFF